MVLYDPGREFSSQYEEPCGARGLQAERRPSYRQGRGQHFNYLMGQSPDNYLKN
jgi:hypothetical protein